MCSKNQAMAILGELYTACAGLFHNGIKDAYLYGSYARGDYTAESDIDILLTVTSDRTEIARMRHLIAEITSDLSLKHDVTVSLTVKPYADFEEYAGVLPFYTNVLKEGIRYGV